MQSASPTNISHTCSKNSPTACIYQNHGLVIKCHCMFLHRMPHPLPQFFSTSFYLVSSNFFTEFLQHRPQQVANHLHFPLQQFLQLWGCSFSAVIRITDSRNSSSDSVISFLQHWLSLIARYPVMIKGEDNRSTRIRKAGQNSQEGVETSSETRQKTPFTSFLVLGNNSKTLNPRYESTQHTQFGLDWLAEPFAVLSI